MERVTSTGIQYVNNWHQIDSTTVARNTATGVLVAQSHLLSTAVFIEGEYVAHRWHRTVDTEAERVTWTRQVGLRKREGDDRLWFADSVPDDARAAMSWVSADEPLRKLPERDTKLVERWTYTYNVKRKEVDEVDLFCAVQKDDPWDWHPVGCYTKPPSKPRNEETSP